MINIISGTQIRIKSPEESTPRGQDYVRQGITLGKWYDCVGGYLSHTHDEFLLFINDLGFPEGIQMNKCAMRLKKVAPIQQHKDQPKQKVQNDNSGNDSGSTEGSDANNGAASVTAGPL